MKRQLSVQQRRTLAGLAMTNLNRQRPAPTPANYKRPETPQAEFARMHREQDAADRQAFEDATGVTELKKNTTAYIAQISATWRKPLDELKAIHSSLLVDPFENLPRTADGKPLTEAASPKITQAIANFEELMYSRQQALSAEGKQRLILYVAKHGAEDNTIDATLVSCWESALGRLRAMNAFAEGDAAFVDPEPAAPAPKQPETVDELRASVEQEFLNAAGPLWESWIDSLRQTFNFVPNAKQKKAAIDCVVGLNLQVLDPASWDTTRRALVKSFVFPESCLTQDDLLSFQMDNFDLSTPAGKAAYVRERNRILYNQPD